MPTDDEHARCAALLNEAMDAGACGWSAQRLIPDGPSAVQRDFDGSPMNTDVMHDETCLEMARGARRAQRRLPGTDAGELGSEGGCASTSRSSRSQRPADHVRSVVQRRIASRIAIATRSKWLERCRQQRPAGLWPGRHHRRRADASPSRTGTCSTIPTRGAKRPPARVAERTDKLGDPRRRDALKAQMPRESLITSYFDEIIITRCVIAREQAVSKADAAQGGESRPASIRST